MIKVNKKMVKRFLDIMENYGEFVFGDYDYIKKQLEICLNSQGYWSGLAIRVYYDENIKDFYIGTRY